MRPRSNPGKRLFILSLDGVPCSFLKEGIAAGRFPNLGRLGEPVEIASTFPPVSSVAWATFSTGVNPGRHGVFGFLELDRATGAETIPTAANLCSPTLWKMLNAQGKRTIVMNVPLTYPPQELDGIMISCFLCPDLARGVTPRSLLPRLRRLDYRIEPDPSLAATDRGAYLGEILATLRAERRVLFDLLPEPWDLFMAHVMMTDRMNHFFWQDGLDPKSEFHEAFLRFYREVDELVGEVDRLLPADVEVFLLSDHGFSSVKAEVDLNALLAQEGYLCYGDGGAGLADIARSSRAYSLIPGRVYLGRSGGNPGSHGTDAQERPTREDIRVLLSRLENGGGKRLLERVVLREEAYSGDCSSLAPDLVLLGSPGYDLKAKTSPGPVMAAPALRSGMHTYGDAFALRRGGTLRPGGTILDATPTVFRLMGLPIPQHLEGTSLLPSRSRR
ncbi:MAG: alkaline phosphatase family protein [Candidatus Bipolaricaulota bacterium]|nr:alkaline phosphatase family protein [Candidatus Bipolaricaulota bacterium]